MFSNLIGHTRAFFPQANSNDHIGTDVGDFDQTPPPSSRVSVDVPRSEDMGSEAIKELRTNHDTASLGHLESPLTDSEVSGTNKLTPLTKTRQFEPSTETTNTLGAIPAPPYHKTSLSQDGMAIQHSPLEPSLGGQDDHEVEDIPRTTGILCADKEPKSSSGEIDQRPTFEQDSPRSRNQFAWLKRLSRTAKSSDSQLTEPQPGIKLIRSDDRRPSEPVLPSSMALRKMSAWSTLSGKSDPGVDGVLFKRAFSDLERLLDEALSLALEVADHSEAAVHATHPAVSNEHGTDHVGESNLSMSNRPQENVEVFPTDGVDVAYPARPGCRRAATYTAVPKRPRLADVVESYSGTYQELRTRNQAGRRQQSSTSRRSSLSRKSRRSNKGSKTNRRQRPIMLKDLRSTNALLDIGGIDAKGKTTAHKSSAAVNVSSAVRSGTSHDALPEHNIAGRRLQGEHGINLRKRSHAIAVSSPRLTNTASWRAILLASRTLMGGSLGFATMNFHSVLTDLFGASLMCQHPHEEVVDHFDARRHGGGMGIWLGIWTWCWIGSLGLGFLIGAAIIDKHSPAWGFYVSIMMIAVVLILNVICPEVRRSAFRRSIAEVRTGGDISRRLARGEVMMHRVKTGPKWWGQEAYHGVRLSLEMLEQPGFAVVAIYVAWIYAQVVLVIILLGSLVSRFYHLRSPYVGLHVAAVALGALLAIPFQKASIFSRSRNRENKVNREVLGKKIVWSSHLVRRAVFTIALPIGGACYAAVSSGPPISSECNGLIMETFDTSDLSPGMVGRHRDPTGQDQRRTNYSSFPRVTAGFAMIQSFSYILAAGSTALGGHVTRKLGQQVATSVVAAILFLLTVLLLLVLIRFKNVLIIPRSKSEEMEKITQARRRSSKRRASMPNDLRALMEEDYAWRPTMIGNPMGKNRRMNVLEMGNLTRWQDIRRRNKLIDAGVHLNRDTLDQGLDALDVALENHIDNMRQNASGFFRRGSLRKHGSRLRRSNQSSEQTFHDLELDMLDPVGTPSESSQQPRLYVKRECVMGQTIKEENKDEAQAGPSTSQKDHT
ncbi:polyamine transport [Fusarium mexicanum]|uniref:Polyamine transport n=1 Tax=Fusarium mexicanum TaxID=751941 RepID=A0A8H5IG22_9HYPO|nr:polyamine transport [Fusarium mexicanum]